MPVLSRHVRAVAVLCAAVSIAGCAIAPATPQASGSQVAVEGSIASIDTQPWTYDGNAVIVIATAAAERVEVHLPARWNLCAAAPVEVAALAVGMPVRVVGTRGEDGRVVVCQSAAHQLIPATP